eukprot:CAMPEP_0119507968 /NCGR_PEP_ID=MMETSP1344-20130328/27712_1 /TAXON_ID=236787 /ORGANISM="Florenciella parvula, Strain CCMP2471" /LENGTH=107 /DNA_ID=CAMNT_0007544653 /DNA_START=888 /DNA_END=1211 /DNA_ORIENTATION=-
MKRVVLVQKDCVRHVSREGSAVAAVQRELVVHPDWRLKRFLDNDVLLDVNEPEVGRVVCQVGCEVGVRLSDHRGRVEVIDAAVDGRNAQSADEQQDAHGGEAVHRMA